VTYKTILETMLHISFAVPIYSLITQFSELFRYFDIYYFDIILLHLWTAQNFTC